MSWITTALNWILVFFKSLILTLWDMVTDVFYLIIDLILSTVGVVIDGVFSALTFDPLVYVSAIPPDVMNILGLLGVGQGLVIIGTAILIRLGLQLIPFVRLGS